VSDDLLTVTVTDRGHDVVIEVAGELDFGTMDTLLEVVQPPVGEGRSVVLDLAELGFCDSTGLGALVRLHKQAQDAGGALCLARVRPQIMSTIRLTMLHRLLVIRDEVPEAGGGGQA